MPDAVDAHIVGAVGDLLLDGPSRTCLDHLAKDGRIGSVQSVDDDDSSRADHHDLLSFNVYPYAGAFMDAGGRAGGHSASIARSHYEQAGWKWDALSEPPDHLGHELKFVAWSAKHRPDIARQFVHEHVMGWLPMFTSTVERHDVHPYVEAVNVVMAEVADYHGPSATALSSSAVTGARPDATASSVGEIVNYLTEPSQCGVYLSRADIRRLGQASDAPAGFGSRRRMMHQLLESCVASGALVEVVNTLSSWVDESERRWRELGDVTEWSSHWMARLGETRDLLITMVNQLPSSGALTR